MVNLYAVEIDLDNPNTSHTQVVDLTGRDKRVLDVGCWTGAVGRVLKSRGCSVSGVEIDEEAAAVAADHLDQVVVTNLDADRLVDHFAADSFDVVIFADVLEHLTDPVGVLVDAQRLLAPGGSIVISIPNVTHGSLRLALLQGRWDSTDTGLLDRTHIKFYSRSGLVAMLAEAGLVVDALRGTTADPLSVEVEIDPGDLPDDAVEWVREQPDALVYQFQVRAVPGTAGAVTPDIVLQGDVDVVRWQDEHTESRLRSQRDALMMKDHVIGLQAATTTAQAHTRKLLGRVTRLKETVERKDATIRQRDAEIARLRRRGLGGLARRLRRRLRA